MLYLSAVMHDVCRETLSSKRSLSYWKVVSCCQGGYQKILFYVNYVHILLSILPILTGSSRFKGLYAQFLVAQISFISVQIEQFYL